MNNGQMKARLISFSHRADLEPELQDFINAVSQRLNNRFGLQLGNMSADTDSNPVIANHDRLYLYGAMRELSIWIKDFEEGVRFDELFDKECSRMNIHNTQDSWVTNGTSLTYIRNERETAILKEEGNAP